MSEATEFWVKFIREDGTEMGVSIQAATRAEAERIVRSRFKVKTMLGASLLGK